MKQTKRKKQESLDKNPKISKKPENNEAKLEPRSPAKVSSSKSVAFSFPGESSFSHGTLIGPLSVAMATVRKMLLTELLL